MSVVLDVGPVSGWRCDLCARRDLLVGDVSSLRHRESLSELPLIALLMPEYLLTPGDPATPAGMWLLTAALVIGSFCIVSALAAVVWRYIGRPA